MAMKFKLTSKAQYIQNRFKNGHGTRGYNFTTPLCLHIYCILNREAKLAFLPCVKNDLLTNTRRLYQKCRPIHFIVVMFLENVNFKKLNIYRSPKSFWNTLFQHR